MLSGWFILVASVAYIGLLFFIAYYGDKDIAAYRKIVEDDWG